MEATEDTSEAMLAELVRIRVTVEFLAEAKRQEITALAEGSQRVPEASGPGAQ